MQTIFYRASCFTNYIFTVDYSCLLLPDFYSTLNFSAHFSCSLRWFWILVLLFCISAVAPIFMSCSYLISISYILPPMSLSILLDYTRSKTYLHRTAFNTSLNLGIGSLIATLWMLFILPGSFWWAERICWATGQ